MHTLRALFLVGCLVFLLSKTTYSITQVQNADDIMPSSWVDSIFESLSPTERICQLLVMKMDANDTTSFGSPILPGGIIVEAGGPVSYGRTVNSIQKKTKVPALIFADFGECFAPKIDSIEKLASPLTLSAISEPHLLYETGQTIGDQCQLLGIHGFLTSNEESPADQTILDPWQKSEIYQGFINRRIIPADSINLYSFNKLDLSIFTENNGPVMVLVQPEEVAKFIQHIEEALEEDLLDENFLNIKCKQILEKKAWAGLDVPQGTDVPVMAVDQKFSNFQLLKQELAEASITVLNNASGLLPIGHLENSKIASLSIGKSDNTVFETFLNNYTRVDHFHINYYASDQEYADLWTSLIGYDVIIQGLYESDFLKARLNGTESFALFQEWLNDSGKSITTLFGDPVILADPMNQILKSPALILAYQDNEITNALVPQLIFGGIEADGSLPLSINDTYQKGQGHQIHDIGRFSYTFPEAVGLDGDKLNKIDSIVEMAIASKAIPGCQVLIAKDNRIIFKKSYGFHTYDSVRRVTDRDLYDLASVTKVSSALPGLMKLYEEGKFDLDATLGTYLPYFNRGNKKKLTYREILAHQSGMLAWIPYWRTTIRKNGKYRRKTLSTMTTEDYPYEIAPGLYLHNEYKRKIYKQIKKSKIGEKKYLYSGLTFYLFPEIIENITGMDYQEYIYDNFYKPLGASTLTYNPMDQFEIDQIVPTEYDSLFRKTQIHGKVHDEGASMMEGVSANAGLFANANDLAKLFQMYCNYGTYGNREYLNEETIMEFTRCQYPENDNRRGLGFDRPLPEPHENGNTAKSVSQLSFGHTGFTGTFVWADPAYNLVYIFLSNRVYQTRNNTKLYDLNVRTNIQELIYEAMQAKDLNE